jgi:hypothetical protein
MKTVELYARVRHAVQIQGMSRRAAAEQFGIDPRTGAKMLKCSVPPEFDAFIGVIDAILAADKDRPKKQRHRSKRIFERLRDEHGFTGGVTIVRNYISGWRQRTQEMFAPLAPTSSTPPLCRVCGSRALLPIVDWNVCSDQKRTVRKDQRPPLVTQRRTS